MDNVYVKIFNGREKWDDYSGYNQYFEVQIQPNRQSGELKTIKLASIYDFIKDTELSPDTVNVGDIGTEVLTITNHPWTYHGFTVISVQNKGKKIIVKFDGGLQKTYVYRKYNNRSRYVPDGSVVETNKNVHIYFSYKFTGVDPVKYNILNKNQILTWCRYMIR